MTQTAGSSAPSASLLMTPSCVLQSTSPRDRMPPEGPGQARELGMCELPDVQQGQVQGPPPGPGQPPVSTQAGGWMDGEQPCQGGLGGAGEGKAGHEPAVCARSPESQPCPGLHPQQCGHRAREEILPLCPALLRHPQESCIQLWSPQHRAERELLDQQWCEGWNPSAGRTGWESWGCSAWRGEGCGETLEQLPVPGRRIMRKIGTGFLAGPVAIGQGVTALNWKRGDLDWGEGRKSLLWGWWRWPRLPREVVDAPSLETFQVRLDGALSNLIQVTMSTGRGVGQDGL